MNRILIYSLCLIFLLSGYLSAQKNSIKFDNISLKDGLSQSTVNSILQDSKGFMWFATIDGLNKFDGYDIKVYRNKPGDANSIVGNAINTLTESKDGLIWIGTQNDGLCMYNQIKDKFVTIDFNTSNEIHVGSENIRKIFEDSQNNLWIGTANGLFKFNRKTKTIIKYRNNTDLSYSISSNAINDISEDDFGNIWIATDNGLNKLRKMNDKFVSYHKSDGLPHNKINSVFVSNSTEVWAATQNGLAHITQHSNPSVTDIDITVYQQNKEDQNSISGNITTALLKDNSGYLWIGTENGGLNRFDRKTGKFISYQHDPTFANSISVNHILSLYQDKTNVLWIGTSLGGINKWNKTVEGLDIFRHNPYDSNSLSTSQVRSVYEDRDGVFWIGTVDGGLNRWNTEENTFTRFTNNPQNPNSISHNHVRSIYEDTKGNFWVGTDGGGLNLFDRKRQVFTNYTNSESDSTSLSHDRVYRIYEDSKKRLWIATYGGGLNRYRYATNDFERISFSPDEISGLSNNYITSIIETHDQKLWIGTYGGGLNIWDGESATFRHYKNNPDDMNSLGDNRIYSLYEDKKYHVWIGTKGGGLNRYLPEEDRFERFTEDDGLPNNVVMGVLEDNDNHLWLSTNNGLCKFDKSKANTREELTRNYDVRDGLQSNEFLVGSFFKASDGKLLFGGINGFNAFYPKNIKDNPHIPEIVITGFQIFNQEARLDSAISAKNVIYLEHDQNFISFDFVALNYIFPEKNQYAYKLEGYDKDWNRVHDRRFANYTNLPPKNYVFHVLGSNNDGVWNETGTKIAVNIKPAWYQTMAFKISAVAFVIISIFMGVHMRIKNIERQKIKLEKLVKERTAEVVQQKEQIEMHMEEIQAQRDEIEIQRDLATKQRDKITIQNKEITDSIIYAKRIQTATLPQQVFHNGIVSDSFILFKPKDIVSGDFYWLNEINNKLIVVAADCTGHGVPGAFMSMLGISFLNKIIVEKEIIGPDQILNRLRANIIDALHQQGADDEARDGMDISLCVIDKENMTVGFAGANNPLYMVRHKQDYVYKGDKMPIAIFDIMDPFEKECINVQLGDTFYLFSDGYADQFGGPRQKKFKYKPFRDLLVEISEKPMHEQKLILDNTFEDWKGEIEQIDDVVVIGFRI